MSDAWLEIDVAGVISRVELKRGLTRLGGASADVTLAGPPRGELHIWDDPPKAVYLGSSDPPRIDGAEIDERDLRSGDLISWAGASIRFRSRRPPPPPKPGPPAPPPVLEEIPLPGARPPAIVPRTASASNGAGASAAQVLGPAAIAPTASADTPGARAWARVRAGMLVELGLADRRSTARWQEAVMRNEYDADACARELLAETQVGPDDPRLLDRSGRLLRDFLMTPLMQGARGASRRMRSAAKGGTAFIVSQFVVFTVFASVLLVVMLLVRLKWGTSFDALFDSVLGR